MVHPIFEGLQPNRRTILTFLNKISGRWREDEVFELRFLGEGKTPHNCRFSKPEIQQMVEFICAMNTKQMNAYLVVNPVPANAPRWAKDEHIQCAHYAFVDADERGAAERSRNCQMFNIDMEIITGTKPFLRNHIYFGFRESFSDMRQWTELQKQLSRYLVTDAAIHNPSRIMRIAGTVSYPTERKIKRGYVPEVARLIIGGGYV